MSTMYLVNENEQYSTKNEKELEAEHLLSDSESIAIDSEDVEKIESVIDVIEDLTYELECYLSGDKAYIKERKYKL